MRPIEIVEKLSDDVLALVRQHVPWRPGARELLAALRARDVPCALVTMSWKRLTDEVVRQLPPDSFQSVITGDMVMNGKPHPEPYRRAAEEVGVDATACVAIEDSPTGIASAEAAGCVVVAVPNQLPIPETPHRIVLPTLRGVTPEQLGDYIENTPPPVQREATLPTDPPPRRRQLLGDRRTALAALAAAVLLVGAGVWWFAVRDTKPTYDPGAFNVHAWVPDWELDQSTPQLPDRANVFHQVSPFWYETRGVDLIDLSARVDTDEEREATEDFLDEARNRSVPLVASITDATDSGVMAAMLADPTERAAHVAAIAEFADSNDFAGIDINYENFAFQDDRDTWATTRPNWVSFISELGARLHADGRLLTVSVPWVVDGGRTEDSGYWVYDYGAIAPHVDAIRVLADDYSVAERDRSHHRLGDRGGRRQHRGRRWAQKLVLGIPLYGRNWVTATGERPDSADGDTAVQLDAVDELIARRGATPTSTR